MRIPLIKYFHAGHAQTPNIWIHYHYITTLYVKRLSSLTITISVSCCMCILCHRPGFRLCPGWWGSRCPLLVVLGGSASSSQARPGAASHLAGHNNTTHPWAAAYTVHCRYLDIEYCQDITIYIMRKNVICRYLHRYLCLDILSQHW